MGQLDEAGEKIGNRVIDLIGFGITKSKTNQIMLFFQIIGIHFSIKKAH